MANDEDGYVSTSVVCKRYGIANITLKRWLKDPAINFPKPVVFFGNRLYFKFSEIKDWETTKRWRAARSPEPSAVKETEARTPGERLRQWRGKRTLGKAAQVLGVSAPTYLRWETGERGVGPSKVGKVAEITGIAAAELRPDIFGSQTKKAAVAEGRSKEAMPPEEPQRDDSFWGPIHDFVGGYWRIMKIHGKPKLRIQAGSRRI